MGSLSNAQNCQPLFMFLLLLPIDEQVVPNKGAPSLQSTSEWTSLFEPFGCLTYQDVELE